MRNKLGLKYRAVKFNDVQANSERCLVLRQQYALKMLELLSTGKRIINVDESWVDCMDYTRRHWCLADQPGKAKKPVTPRISLIAAVCSDGLALLSLT